MGNRDRVEPQGFYRGKEEGEVAKLDIGSDDNFVVLSHRFEAEEDKYAPGINFDNPYKSPGRHTGMETHTITVMNKALREEYLRNLQDCANKAYNAYLKEIE